MKKLLYFCVLLLVLCAAAYGFTQFTVNVLAKQSFLQDTANIPTTTVYTVTKSGDYRISVYVEMQVSQTFFEVTPTVSWTDDIGMQVSNGFPAESQAGATFGQITFAVHALANTPIQISSTVTSSPSSPYSLFITVERLTQL